MTQRRLAKPAALPLRARLALALAALLTGAGAPVGGLQGHAHADDASKPTVSISPNPVDYKRGVKVTISGSGFRPNQELGLVVTMGAPLPTSVASSSRNPWPMRRASSRACGSLTMKSAESS